MACEMLVHSSSKVVRSYGMLEHPKTCSMNAMSNEYALSILVVLELLHKIIYRSLRHKSMHYRAAP